MGTAFETVPGAGMVANRRSPACTRVSAVPVSVQEGSFASGPATYTVGARLDVAAYSVLLFTAAQNHNLFPLWRTAWIKVMHPYATETPRWWLADW